MEILSLTLAGPKLLKPKIFPDERGFFFESYREPLYRSHGIDCLFVQDNHSYSKRGTIRGLHFQRAPGQAKLVRVVYGKIFDVVIDIRPHSPTFGKWEGVYLDAENHEQLFVPIGFAHGFCAISEETHVLYKVSSIYDPLEEKTIRFDDPAIGIQWPTSSPLLSSRDRSAPLLKEVLQ